jgi:hypothetical protein
MHSRRRFAAWALALAPITFVVALGTPSCSSKSSGGAQLASGCSLNSDCADPLVCIFALCHQACNETRDCTTAGDLCVKINGNGVCELPQEVTCSAEGGKSCQQGLTCSNDQCRTACQPATASTDCLQNQQCSGGACYDPTELDGGTEGGGGEGGTTEGGGTESGIKDAGYEANYEAGPLGYVASNLGAINVADGGYPVTPEGGVPLFGSDGGIDWNAAPTVTVSGNCTSTQCLPAPVIVTLQDQAGFQFPASVYFMSALTVDSSANLAFSENRPIILAVLGPVDIQGTISVAAFQYNGGNGATNWSGTSAPQGPGAGGNGFTANFPASGGGGGSYCGVGGTAAVTSGTAAPGGSVYGNATITPLLAGSAGGYVDGYQWGAGGGALQISSGVQIHVRGVGIVNAGGGSAYGGGGSGGAILLEAPTLFLEGYVTANGGGGGGFSTTPSSTYGANATTNNTPPSGGVIISTTVVIGGSGSAGKTITGGNGIVPNVDAGSFYGGGGGAAGWIRLNSATGQAQLGANVQISPDLTTTCASQGTIQ